MIILSFDYGTKNIGLAVAETELNYSVPIKSIIYDKKNIFFKKIKETINYWNPKYIIIGYPYKIKKKINKKIKKFSYILKEKYNKNIFLYNENYSTKEAKFFLNDYKKKKNNSYCIHSIAAKIILDSWLKSKYH
ncbi:Putative pre-16S rRNA nuclease [Buchnera aphidicola (Cinara kochiana kochiana)]|uniref:Putative pre-16S rRNA nuclease n=1 Tax=Buchnera aphidicola (Cinara kochiana kochiana) TaxID=2518976 RepID=A0A451D633_9GAMM|nr:Holliday junction resolvase RuvX [Buchnera aphidicola]VFP81266.1 Putative pre-16S rRNA nuclease [Buchnera aphidicola (Cinara kochiana kochiana)]